MAALREDDDVRVGEVALELRSAGGGRDDVAAAEHDQRRLAQRAHALVEVVAVPQRHPLDDPQHSVRRLRGHEQPPEHVVGDVVRRVSRPPPHEAAAAGARRREGDQAVEAVQQPREYRAARDQPRRRHEDEALHDVGVPVAEGRGDAAAHGYAHHRQLPPLQAQMRQHVLRLVNEEVDRVAPAAHIVARDLAEAVPVEVCSALEHAHRAYRR
ncbi:electron transport complex subunit RsxC [Babesia caballi]|uniref:Electron transport complex subunit RsxC n=1 Tax=Babesia caballi TaxID=5871 RepID=A0AAV4LYQ6_BABCB|nr:electron transport complex subunit RsxC [Babesia caballi]